ncbi:MULTISPECIES: response regulator transcription factor [Sphingobacterium]|jgi:DNA-binding response OmpR family regulator|uniref:response regulator transcription factor n=1 Tax=Sphingobacterium TaxID=28453 RepID=UPI00038A2485|nr:MULTISPECIES: response regulator transcription factor [unclassified Sphingobacterium]KKX50426.1 transcriptional regulator [Sphingobacterium sp. IITKGP-BTPF85]MBB2953444.1 DNA-binding response OmpR family regulator [Sphingobacterium sp. JUb56]MCS3554984.1 DNA-binding response OmpR family regulator [Sphingobacterium sp. JUb21]TCR05619.1 DNA-binding response OmpR family regulator [Sphingobacterium sp. JUb20]
MKILLIEDEVALSQVIMQSLEAEKYLVEQAFDYNSALEKISIYSYDCILLDIMLPGGSGLQLLEKIKEIGKEESIIILSAKDSVDDKVKGLELGADDYLAKPFHLAELHARIKSIIRRKNQHGDDIITYKNIAVNTTDRSIQINNKPVILNRKEFDLLYYFIIRPTKLIQKNSLAESIWGDHIDQVDSLDFIYSQIKNLRKKLKDNHADIDIQAVYGIGYKLI